MHTYITITVALDATELAEIDREIARKNATWNQRDPGGPQFTRENELERAVHMHLINERVLRRMRWQQGQCRLEWLARRRGLVISKDAPAAT